MVSKLTTIVIAVLCLFSADCAVAQTDSTVAKPHESLNEIMVGIGVAGYGYWDDSHSTMGNISGALYTVEYRYAVFSNLTIGAASQLSTFKYERELCDASLDKGVNVVASFIPRVYFRTSSSMSTSAFILFLGSAFTYTSLTEACLRIDNVSVPIEHIVNEVSSIDIGYNFGFGFETGSIHDVRLRLHMEYKSSSLDTHLQILSFGVALSYSW